MKEDYLWDKSGKPDPEVERLEELLGEFRHRGNEPPWPADLGPQRSRSRGWRIRLLAIAAAVAVAISVGWLSMYWVRDGWKVERLAGAPRLSGIPLVGEGLLRVGQTLETDGESRAELSIGEIGFVEVHPGSVIRLERNKPTEHRMAMDRGKIDARIFAPPRLFFVNTPSATAVDLGCAYTLEVDDSGNGRLQVKLGWVGFESNGLESLMPAGSACITRKALGPGTPFFQDASEELKEAVARFDTSGRREQDLRTILKEARKRDSLTLWHLLTRVNSEHRGLVYDRLLAMVNPPNIVTREGILRLDRQMIEAWWDNLGLGETNWWKLWKGPWPPRVR
jgi:ferric-dicitrate binding protein FerR (iron transport regulator)